MKRLLVFACLTFALFSTDGVSQTLRWSSAGDVLTFDVIGLWQGGRLVQEAKALVPSAWYWAHADSSAKSRVLDLALGAYRSPDPHLRVKAGYVMRKVAPDAHKVELADVSGQGLSEELLAAMGTDLGAIHATRRRRSILKDLRNREPRWLSRAADAAERAVRRDFGDFKESQD